jgi:hypothetical protein
MNATWPVNRLRHRPGDLMRRRRRYSLDAASGLDGPPKGGRAEAWVYGVGVALPAFAYGLFCAFAQRAWFLSPKSDSFAPFQREILREWNGRPAIALGIVFIAIGAFAQFHWFWSNFPRLAPYYEIGKLASLILLVVGIGWWLFEAAW